MRTKKYLFLIVILISTYLGIKGYKFKKDSENTTRSWNQTVDVYNVQLRDQMDREKLVSLSADKLIDTIKTRKKATKIAILKLQKIKKGNYVGNLDTLIDACINQINSSSKFLDQLLKMYDSSNNDEMINLSKKLKEIRDEREVLSNQVIHVMDQLSKEYKNAGILTIK